VNGIEKNEFINRIRKILGADPIPGTAPSSSATPQQASTPAATPAQTQTPPPIESTRPPPVPALAPAQEEHHPVSPILPPSSKAKGKQKATPPDPKRDSKASANAAQQAARDALRKKKQEEKEELERIRARIEADKAERKAQAAAQKAERELERQAATSTTSSPAPSSTGNRRSLAKQVNLNVRLFDGRTVRSTFPRDAKLQDDVRTWIDREVVAEDPNAKHPPYFFKQILAPLPSRELSAGEESETLGDIDLAPSATLVLVPVKGYTEAYSGGSSGVVGGVVGGVSGLVGGAFGLAYNAVGYVGSTLGSVVGYGSGSSNAEPAQAAATEGRTLSETRPETPTAASIRVRTLADQRAGETRSQEFYNGNSVCYPSASILLLAVLILV
jgi:hypothetical protein